MNRYINVSEDVIKGVFKKLNHKNIYPKASDEIILRNYLDEFPTADVAPVVHGEWYMSTDPLRISQYEWVCSNCHSEEIYEYNYCPNCGAKMDGGK